MKITKPKKKKEQKQLSHQITSNLCYRVIITAKHTCFASTKNFTSAMPAAVKGRDPHFIDMALVYGDIIRAAHGILLSF